MEETTEKLERAMRLAPTARHALLATVDETGTPRMTPVEECRPAGGGRVAVRAWVDISGPAGPGGGRLALLLWDGDGHGYQLTGRIVRLQETEVLDGLAEIEQEVHFPQVERTLLVQVDSVEEFHFAPAERFQARP
jgi:predicted pyridoxine 5'-phosphate oxidase superfamily flavin-nucleotide-binding protein